MSSTFYIILLMGVTALSPVIAEPDWTRLACNNGSKPVVLEGTRGVITSPGYPRHYPDNADCEWLLSAPPGGSVNLLTIHALTTESGYDTLNISSELGAQVKLTGSVDGYIYDSQGSQTVLLKFTSDSSTTGAGFSATYELVSEVQCGPQSATLPLGAIPAHARQEDGEVFVEGYSNQAGCKVAFSSSDPEDTMLTFPYHTCGGRPDQADYNYGRYHTTSPHSINKLTFDVVLGVRRLKAPDITVVRMRMTCGGRSTQYESQELTTYDIRLRARDVEPPYTFRVYDKSRGEESDHMTRIANGDVITLAATFTGSEPVESDDKLALHNCEMFVKDNYNFPKAILDSNGCPAAGEEVTIEQTPNHGTEANFLVKGLPYGATVHFRCSIYLCYHGQVVPPGIKCNQPAPDWCSDLQRRGRLL